jgi:hypothetical protein
VPIAKLYCMESTFAANGAWESENEFKAIFELMAPLVYPSPLTVTPADSAVDSYGAKPQLARG